MAGRGGYLWYVRNTLDGAARSARPPLTQRLRPRHWTVLDYAVGALLGLILFAAITHSIRHEGVPPLGPVGAVGAVHYYPVPVAVPLAAVLVAVTALAVALRRRRPLLMLGVLLACSVVVTTLAGPQAGSLTYFLPVSYVLYLVAANYEQRGDAVRVLAAVFTTLVADTVLRQLAGRGRAFDPGAMISVTLCVVVVWTTGYIVRQRRRYAVRLQVEAASKAVTQERLRIARELHDVVAHSMSVIAVQAGYGQYVIDSQPGDARAALGAIQATSREALDEMRRMLGALRQADEGFARDGDARAFQDVAGDQATAPLSPAPGLADLDRLLSRTAGAGVQVDVKRAGRPRELPASIDLSAYRIVQEALTNVVKHAQTSSCRVLLGYSDDALVIEVTDNGAGLSAPVMAGAGLQVPVMAGAGALAGGSGTVHHGSLGVDRRSLAWSLGGGGTAPGGGHGIIGMRERVTMLGGEFSAGPLPGYGFRVSARLPLPQGGA